MIHFLWPYGISIFSKGHIFIFLMNADRIMKILSLAFLILLISLAEGQSNLEDWMRQSSFVFQGTVLKTKATTMDIVPAAEDTYVVRLDEPLKTPNQLGDLKGKELTLRVKQPDTLKEGQTMIIFARGWLLGDGIALEGVGYLPEKSFADMQKEIQQVEQSMTDQNLEKRISDADLVVAGKVTKIERLNETKMGRISEHDPQWEEAIIKIDSVLKGDKALKTVTFRFPGNTDIAFVGVPKFKVDDQGIWILHATKEAKGERAYYTALDPLDFQPMSEIDRVRGLIQRTEKGPH